MEFLVDFRIWVFHFVEISVSIYLARRLASGKLKFPLKFNFSGKVVCENLQNTYERNFNLSKVVIWSS